MQCTATSKRSGHPCKAHAVTGRTVCYTHGGTTPQGTASGTFKTGRYSKHLPERLLARYEQARTDPNLLGLHEDVALLEARLVDLLSRVDTGESGTRWTAVQAALGAYRTARGTPGAGAAFAVLTEAINAGVGDALAWEDIAGVLEAKRKLGESERKRLVDLHQLLTAGEAGLLMARFLGIVQTQVPDARQFSTILREVRGLLEHEQSRRRLPDAAEPRSGPDDASARDAHP